MDGEDHVKLQPYLSTLSNQIRHKIQIIQVIFQKVGVELYAYSDNQVIPNAS